MEINEEFDGVFRFSNNSDEDFIALWNNKEYTFPAHTRSPMIIPNESLENIQEIRKKWAFKWAEREWFKTDQYKKMKEMGGGLPPVRQEKDLEPLIQMCLEPLPISKASVKEGKSQEVKTRASKPITKDSFDPRVPPDNIETLGEQSTRFNN